MQGSARQWLFDNPKSVVLERHGDAARFHPDLLEVAGHYHVQPRLCAVGKGNQKGRVERAVRYLRERYFAGRRITDLATGNRELARFLETIALPRPHPVFRDRSGAAAPPPRPCPAPAGRPPRPRGTARPPCPRPPRPPPRIASCRSPPTRPPA